VNMSDMIDFPCSSDWLDHYHRQGLTPRTSGKKDREYLELLRRIEKLERQNQEMLKFIEFLVKSLKVHPHDDGKDFKDKPSIE